MPNLCKLGDVYFTIVEEESYTYSNSITDRAVEKGSNISDHAKRNPVKVKISGIITGKNSYPQEQLTKLRNYSSNRNIVRYVGVQRFGTMMIESFDNEHTKEIEDGIKFSIDLREVIICKQVAVNVNTGCFNIPDIEKLKEQLEEQKKAKEEAKRNNKKTSSSSSRTVKSTRAKVTPKSKKGRQTKQPKKKKSVLQNIVSRY
ncbi:hypothetical protein FDF74_12680 [Clostridium niameyense]|uniref:Dit-like phage tail protein N-terminal domain-containing protein n=1 Tax=Clostridium niameyense TaxID=1622073 RepID=A0A6M0RCM0_9CLOT|nr:hypothetical protein [Clostridium niameyense]NEZ48026.1 hypothetical protein [Clostridium niameyense]